MSAIEEHPHHTWNVQQRLFRLRDTLRQLQQNDAAAAAALRVVVRDNIRAHETSAGVNAAFAASRIRGKRKRRFSKQQHLQQKQQQRSGGYGVTQQQQRRASEEGDTIYCSDCDSMYEEMPPLQPDEPHVQQQLLGINNEGTASLVDVWRQVQQLCLTAPVLQDTDKGKEQQQQYSTLFAVDSGAASIRSQRNKLLPHVNWSDNLEFICAACGTSGGEEDSAKMLVCEGTCQRLFHPACVGMPPMAQLALQGQANSLPFQCDSCCDKLLRCSYCKKYNERKSMALCSHMLCRRFYCWPACVSQIQRCSPRVCMPSPSVLLPPLPAALLLLSLTGQKEALSLKSKTLFNHPLQLQQPSLQQLQHKPIHIRRTQLLQCMQRKTSQDPFQQSKPCDDEVHQQRIHWQCMHQPSTTQSAQQRLTQKELKKKKQQKQSCMQQESKSAESEAPDEMKACFVEGSRHPVERLLKPLEVSEAVKVALNVEKTLLETKEEEEEQKNKASKQQTGSVQQTCSEELLTQKNQHSRDRPLPLFESASSLRAFSASAKTGEGSCSGSSSTVAEAARILYDAGEDVLYDAQCRERFLCGQHYCSSCYALEWYRYCCEWQFRQLAFLAEDLQLNKKTNSFTAAVSAVMAAAQGLTSTSSPSSTAVAAVTAAATEALSPLLLATAIPSPVASLFPFPQPSASTHLDSAFSLSKATDVVAAPLPLTTTTPTTITTPTRRTAVLAAAPLPAMSAFAAPAETAALVETTSKSLYLLDSSAPPPPSTETPPARSTTLSSTTTHVSTTTPTAVASATPSKPSKRIPFPSHAASSSMNPSQKRLTAAASAFSATPTTTTVNNLSTTTAVPLTTNTTTNSTTTNSTTMTTAVNSLSTTTAVPLTTTNSTTMTTAVNSLSTTTAVPLTTSTTKNSTTKNSSTTNSSDTSTTMKTRLAAGATTTTVSEPLDYQYQHQQLVDRFEAQTEELLKTEMKKLWQLGAALTERQLRFVSLSFEFVKESTRGWTDSRLFSRQYKPPRPELYPQLLLSPMVDLWECVACAAAFCSRCVPPSSLILCESLGQILCDFCRLLSSTEFATTTNTMSSKNKSIFAKTTKTATAHNIDTIPTNTTTIATTTTPEAAPTAATSAALHAAIPSKPPIKTAVATFPVHAVVGNAAVKRLPFKADSSRRLSEVGGCFFNSSSTASGGVVSACTDKSNSRIAQQRQYNEPLASTVFSSFSSASGDSKRKMQKVFVGEEQRKTEEEEGQDNIELLVASVSCCRSLAAALSARLLLHNHHSHFAYRSPPPFTSLSSPPLSSPLESPASLTAESISAGGKAPSSAFLLSGSGVEQKKKTAAKPVDVVKADVLVVVVSSSPSIVNTNDALDVFDCQKNEHACKNAGEQQVTPSGAVEHEQLVAEVIEQEAWNAHGGFLEDDKTIICELFPKNIISRTTLFTASSNNLLEPSLTTTTTSTINNTNASITSTTLTTTINNSEIATTITNDNQSANSTTTNNRQSATSTTINNNSSATFTTTSSSANITTTNYNSANFTTTNNNNSANTTTNNNNNANSTTTNNTTNDNSAKITTTTNNNSANSTTTNNYNGADFATTNNNNSADFTTTNNNNSANSTTTNNNNSAKITTTNNNNSAKFTTSSSFSRNNNRIAKEALWTSSSKEYIEDRRDSTCLVSTRRNGSGHVHHEEMGDNLVSDGGENEVDGGVVVAAAEGERRKQQIKEWKIRNKKKRTGSHNHTGDSSEKLHHSSDYDGGGCGEEIQKGRQGSSLLSRRLPVQLKGRGVGSFKKRALQGSFGGGQLAYKRKKETESRAGEKPSEEEETAPFSRPRVVAEKKAETSSSFWGFEYISTCVFPPNCSHLLLRAPRAASDRQPQEKCVCSGNKCELDCLNRIRGLQCDKKRCRFGGDKDCGNRQFKRCCISSTTTTTTTTTTTASSAIFPVGKTPGKGGGQTPEAEATAAATSPSSLLRHHRPSHQPGSVCANEKLSFQGFKGSSKLGGSDCGEGNLSGLEVGFSKRPKKSNLASGGRNDACTRTIKGRSYSSQNCKSLPSHSSSSNSGFLRSTTALASTSTLLPSTSGPRVCAGSSGERSPLVYVQRSGEKGLGVFAGQAIPAGQLILEYVGEVLDSESLTARAAAYSLRELQQQQPQHWYILEVLPNVFIDSTLKGNISRLVNHSCAPNCALQRVDVAGMYRLGVFALRPIAADEEITYDYGFTRKGFGQGFLCFCGSSCCRGRVGAGDRRSRNKFAAVAENVLKRREAADAFLCKLLSLNLASHKFIRAERISPPSPYAYRSRLQLDLPFNSSIQSTGPLLQLQLAQGPHRTNLSLSPSFQHPRRTGFSNDWAAIEKLKAGWNPLRLTTTPTTTQALYWRSSEKQVGGPQTTSFTSAFADSSACKQKADSTYSTAAVKNTGHPPLAAAAAKSPIAGLSLESAGLPAASAAARITHRSTQETAASAAQYRDVLSATAAQSGSSFPAIAKTAKSGAVSVPANSLAQAPPAKDATAACTFPHQPDFPLKNEASIPADVFDPPTVVVALPNPAANFAPLSVAVDGSGGAGGAERMHQQRMHQQSRHQQCKHQQCMHQQCMQVPRQQVEQATPAWWKPEKGRSALKGELQQRPCNQLKGFFVASKQKFGEKVDDEDEQALGCSADARLWLEKKLLENERKNPFFAQFIFDLHLYDAAVNYVKLLVLDGKTVEEFVCSKTKTMGMDVPWGLLANEFNERVISQAAKHSILSEDLLNKTKKFFLSNMAVRAKAFAGNEAQTALQDLFDLNWGASEMCALCDSEGVVSLCDSCAEPYHSECAEVSIANGERYFCPACLLSDNRRRWHLMSESERIEVGTRLSRLRLLELFLSSIPVTKVKAIKETGGACIHPTVLPYSSVSITATKTPLKKDGKTSNPSTHSKITESAAKEALPQFKGEKKAASNPDGELRASNGDVAADGGVDCDEDPVVIKRLTEKQCGLCASLWWLHNRKSIVPLLGDCPDAQQKQYLHVSNERQQCHSRRSDLSLLDATTAAICTAATANTNATAKYTDELLLQQQQTPVLAGAAISAIHNCFTLQDEEDALFFEVGYPESF